MELDFTTIPKTLALFPQIIVDFSRKETIEMNIVKAPLKGWGKGAEKAVSKKAVGKCESWVDVGLRGRERL